MIKKGEIRDHLDIGENHEAGLIPMSTQLLLAKADAEIARLRGLVKEASEVAGMGRSREACEMLHAEVYPDYEKEPSSE